MYIGGCAPQAHDAAEFIDSVRRARLREHLYLAGCEYYKMPAVALLEVLSIDYGVPSIDIGRMLDVPVPQIRRWRRSVVEPENRARLGELVALIESLDIVAQVDSPATWLRQRPLPDYALAPRDLYGGLPSATLILDHACGQLQAPALFDLLRPDWRAATAVRYVSAEFVDGTIGLVAKEPPVTQQIWSTTATG